MSYSNLRGKAYIMTGAASGMGRTTSLLLAKQGANVALLDLRKPDHVLHEVKAVGATTGEALTLNCDVQDSVAVDAAVRQPKDHLGALHGAANMAGLEGIQGIQGKGHAIAFSQTATRT